MASRFQDLFAALDVFECSVMFKNAFIKKLPNGKWKVMSEKGKNLGIYDSKEDAKKRLQQVEYFKHKKADSDSSIVDLSGLDDLSYSAIMRELRKIGDEEVVRAFLSTYKEIFDGLIVLKSDDAANQALPLTLMIFSQVYPVKLSEKQDD